MATLNITKNKNAEEKRDLKQSKSSSITKHKFIQNLQACQFKPEEKVQFKLKNKFENKTLICIKNEDE